MNQHLDPQQFNTVLQQIERIMTEPPSVELMAAWERISELEAVLQGAVDNHGCKYVNDANFRDGVHSAALKVLSNQVVS